MKDFLAAMLFVIVVVSVLFLVTPWVFKVICAYSDWVMNF